MNFDVELLGDCDTIIAHLCKQLGVPWNEVLQGFEIPNVSKEFLTPFIPTPPDSPTKDGYKEGVLHHDDVLGKKCCDSEKIVGTGDPLDQCQREDKGNVTDQLRNMAEEQGS
jgi:hypothetical protein